MSSIATVLENLKTQRAYCSIFLSNPDVRIDVRWDTAVGEVEDKHMQRRRIVIDDDEEDTIECNTDPHPLTATFNDSSDILPVIKKHYKKSREGELRSQCALTKTDTSHLLVQDTDAISSLEIFRKTIYSHARSFGITFGKNREYSSTYGYAKDNMSDIIELVHRDHPTLFRKCETSGNTERPHSLKRGSSWF